MRLQLIQLLNAKWRQAHTFPRGGTLEWYHKWAKSAIVPRYYIQGRETMIRYLRGLCPDLDRKWGLTPATGCDKVLL